MPNKIRNVKTLIKKLTKYHSMGNFNKMQPSQVHPGKIIFISYCKKCSRSVLFVTKCDLTGLSSIEGSAMLTKCEDK